MQLSPRRRCMACKQTMRGTHRILWSGWHLVKNSRRTETQKRRSIFCPVCSCTTQRGAHSDPTSAGGDYRLFLCWSGSGRWLLSPAPWSGRNARRGNPTATASPLRNVAPAPAKTPALSARGISWGSSAKSVSVAARKDPFGGDQVSGDNLFIYF